MKKLKLIFFVFISVFLFQSISYSQFSFAIGPTLGLTVPSGRYGGTTMDFYNGTDYGLSSGVNFGAVVRARFLFISIRASAIYQILKNTGTSEPGQGSIETKQSSFMLTAGPELSIKIPFTPIRPYLGLDLILTSFTGQSTFQGVARVPSDGTYDMSSASRTGLGIGLGVEIYIGKKNVLDIGGRYNMHNLFSKSFTGGTDRLASYTALNDDADPLNATDPDKHPIGSSRLISSIQFNIAFLFGF